MLRIVSLFGVACLAVAAVALASLPKTSIEPISPPKNNHDTLLGERSGLLARSATSLYHAQFSLN